MKKNRMTNQRLKILEYLRSVKTHPTAEMVYKEVAKELPNITLATVYRNLNHLAENCEIQRFEVNCTSRFDADMSFHQHCICKKCGHIQDLFEKKITEDTIKKARTTNFEPQSVNVIIYGICKGCKGK
ncbi:transcriptional repressor [Candidatus Woesearchaeota archaeon]|nr:transcriptional repressor [Candidatus Woesearchaeota archaeon]